MMKIVAVDYSNQTDENLMLSYAEGELKAFEELYGRHKDSLYRYVVRQITDNDIAKDLYQEVWSRIIKSCQSYKADAKWTTWAYRIAHNLVVDHYRAYKSVEGEIEQTSTNTPEKSHAQRELAGHIKNCISKLPATQREIFLLSQETDMNLAMISEVVSASHEAVKSRLRYARSALKDCLSRFGVISSQQTDDSGAGQ